MKTLILPALLIVSFMLTPMTVAAVTASDSPEKDHICFRRIDTDSDGRMSFEEFIPFFGKDRAKFDSMDDDKDGNISHDEYEAWLYDRE